MKKTFIFDADGDTMRQLGDPTLILGSSLSDEPAQISKAVVDI